MEAQGGGSAWVGPGSGIPGTAGFAGFAEAVGDLKTAVGKGATLDPDAANALINYLEDAEGDANLAKNTLAQHQFQGIPIGRTPLAEQYKPYFGYVATDPELGASAAYDDLSKKIREAIDTIEESVKSFQQTDEDAAGGLDGTMPI